MRLTRQEIERGAASVLDEWRRAAEAFPLETRQAFLDAVWAGHSIRDACEISGTSYEAATGILGQNIVQQSFSVLNRIAVG